MSNISRFTSKVVTPFVGGGFANCVPGSLHCLWVSLDQSYRDALDSLSEMPHILGDIWLEADDLPDHAYLFII